MDENIFKAYDIRGKYPEEVNEEVFYLIGRTFATFFSGTVAVGGDSRLSTPSLKESLIRGLTDSGAKVFDLGFVPTPVVYFACYKMGFNFGISITGSHLTKEYNGLKICDSVGIPIGYEAGLEKIKQLISTGKFKKGKGELKKMDISKDYINFMKKFSDNLKGIKIVVDGANGIAGKIYSEILRQCGAEIVEMNCEADGNFPNHTPDPMDAKFIVDLEKKVKELKADFGFAFDGDGDRLNIVDETGNVVNTNHVFSLLIENALKNNKNSKVVHDVLCSKLIDDVILKNYGIPVVSRVGHSFIAKRCFDEDAAIAGEVSGHYFFKETNYTDDVLMACLKILKIFKESGNQISELVKKYPKYYQHLERIAVREEVKLKFMEELLRDLKSRGWELITLDGVRVNFENGWMLFRPSNTEPKISVGYESSDKKSFEEIKNIAEKIIDTIPK